VYIRNIIPDGMGVPSPAVLSLLGCGYARFHAGANFALTEFSEVQPRNTFYAESILADRCERSVFFTQIKALREPPR